MKFILGMNENIVTWVKQVMGKIYQGKQGHHELETDELCILQHKDQGKSSYAI